MVVSLEEYWVKVTFAVFMFIMGIIFIGKGLREREMKSQRYFKFGLAMFALMTSVTRMFFLFSDFEIRGTDIYNFYWKAAVISSIIALVFIVLVVETYLVKTKYVFSAIGMIGAVLIILVDIPTAALLNIPLYFALGGIIFVLYIYVAYKSPGTLRKKSLLMLLSLLIFFAGILFDSESLFGFVGGVEGAILNIDLGIVGAICMWVGLGAYLKFNYGEN